MTYQVPQHISKEKIFIINHSEIEGRLDPSVYKPCFKFVSRKYDNVKLPDIAWIDPSCIFEQFSEVSYVPMDAIDSSIGVIKYLETKKNEETKGYTRFKEGDILWAKITPCMQNAKSAIAKNLLNGYGCGSTEFYVIRSKDNNVVMQEYLLFLLRNEKVLDAATNYFGGSAGQQRVSKLFLRTFNVPIPSIGEQKRLCDIIKKAQYIKSQKELKAEKIINDIDNYLLGELGITLPDIDSDLSDRIFCIKSSELVDRLDPRFNRYSVFFKNISSSYSFTTLNEVIINKGQYGANESAIDYNVGDVRYIRITDIDELGYLKDTDKKTASTIDSNYLLKSDDILFARSGSVGKCYIHKNLSCPAIFAGYLIRFDLDKNKINPDFLFYYCNSKMYKLWVDTIQRPAVQANINAQEFRKMIIPLPPLQKQEEISKHILELRQKASSLREEGKQILQRANREVEQMILG